MQAAPFYKWKNVQHGITCSKNSKGNFNPMPHPISQPEVFLLRGSSVNKPSTYYTLLPKL